VGGEKGPLPTTRGAGKSSSIQVEKLEKIIKAVMI